MTTNAVKTRDPWPATRDELTKAYEAVRLRAVVHPADERLIVRVDGADRLEFLHNVCSNEIKRAPVGSVVYSLLLTRQAHVVGDFNLFVRSDHGLLEVDRGRWPLMREELEKLIVADDVTLEEQTDWKVTEVVGPLGGGALEAAGVDSASEIGQGRFVERDGFLVARSSQPGPPCFVVVGEGNAVDRVIARIPVDVREAYPPGSIARALEILRIENGIARVGVDTSERTIALEARLERGISFNKGCYLGQETIERATARGQLKRRLFGLRIAGSEVPALGSPVRMAGREIGRLTSAAWSPEFGVIGLAIIHREAWQPGMEVEIEDAAGGRSAVISDLPFSCAEQRVEPAS